MVLAHQFSLKPTTSVFWEGCHTCQLRNFQRNPSYAPPKRNQIHTRNNLVAMLYHEEVLQSHRWVVLDPLSHLQVNSTVLSKDAPHQFKVLFYVIFGFKMLNRNIFCQHCSLSSSQ